MFHTIKRILDIAGDQKKYIYAGIVCNILKTFSMAMMLMAVYVVISHLDSLTAEVIGQGLGILIASVFGRFLFQWLEDISMSAKGFDIFRDYRLAIGEKMKSAPMGYFSDQRLGTIQTTLTSTVVELEQYSMLFITDITGGVSMSVIIIVLGNITLYHQKNRFPGRLHPVHNLANRCCGPLHFHISRVSLAGHRQNKVFLIILSQYPLNPPDNRFCLTGKTGFLQFFIQLDHRNIFQWKNIIGISNGTS